MKRSNQTTPEAAALSQAAAAMGRKGGKARSAAKTLANRRKMWARWHPGIPYPGDASPAPQ